MKIGSILKQVRENKGLTIEQVSKKLGQPPRTLRYYEQDKSVPRLEMLLKLADIYQVSLDELVGREEERKIANPFTVEEFRVITDLLEKKSKEKDTFGTLNTLLDKAVDTLKIMQYRQRLHKFDYDPVPRDIETGNFFMTRRDRLHISRSDLAKACGVTSNVVSEWESGTRKPSRNHIETLKRWLKLTDDEIARYIYKDYKKDHIIEVISQMSTNQLESLNNMISTIIS